MLAGYFQGLHEGIVSVRPFYQLELGCITHHSTLIAFEDAGVGGFRPPALDARVAEPIRAGLAFLVGDRQYHQADWACDGVNESIGVAASLVYDQLR